MPRLPGLGQLPAAPRGRALTMNPTKQQLAEARVLVVGDAMLDRYWHGAVERISPEAPVPVVKVTREEERIGAAANVAYNVSTLGAQASFLGVVGDDEPGHQLEALLQRHRHPHPPQARPGPAHHRQAARHRPPAAAAAHGFRERAGPRGAGAADRGLRRSLLPQQRRHAVLRLRQGRPGAHPGHDRRPRARPASRCWSIPRATTTRATAAPRVITPNRAELQDVVGRWQQRGRPARQGAEPAPVAGPATPCWSPAARKA